MPWHLAWKLPLSCRLVKFVAALSWGCGFVGLNCCVFHVGIFGFKPGPWDTLDIKTLVVWKDGIPGSSEIPFHMENWDFVTVPWNHYYFFPFVFHILVSVHVLLMGLYQKPTVFLGVCTRLLGNMRKILSLRKVHPCPSEISNGEFPSMAQ